MKHSVPRIMRSQRRVPPSISGLLANEEDQKEVKRIPIDEVVVDDYVDYDYDLGGGGVALTEPGSQIQQQHHHLHHVGQRRFYVRDGVMLVEPRVEQQKTSSSSAVTAPNNSGGAPSASVSLSQASPRTMPPPSFPSSSSVGGSPKKEEGGVPPSLPPMPTTIFFRPAAASSFSSPPYSLSGSSKHQQSIGVTAAMRGEIGGAEGVVAVGMKKRSWRLVPTSSLPQLLPLAKPSQQQQASPLRKSGRGSNGLAMVGKELRPGEGRKGVHDGGDVEETSIKRARRKSFHAEEKESLQSSPLLERREARKESQMGMDVGKNSVAEGDASGAGADVTRAMGQATDTTAAGAPQKIFPAKSFTCRWCGLPFPSLTELNTHKSEQHPNLTATVSLTSNTTAAKSKSSAKIPHQQGKKQHSSPQSGENKAHQVQVPTQKLSRITAAAAPTASIATTPRQSRHAHSSTASSSMRTTYDVCHTRCDLCGLLIVRPSLLLRHMLRVHNRRDFRGVVWSDYVASMAFSVRGDAGGGDYDGGDGGAGGGLHFSNGGGVGRMRIGDEGMRSLVEWECCGELYSDRGEFLLHRRGHT